MLILEQKRPVLRLYDMAMSMGGVQAQDDMQSFTIATIEGGISFLWSPMCSGNIEWVNVR